MRIGYLLNTYPLTSTTFIRREIEALEAHGVSLKRYAIRRWSEPLVDARDRAEQNRTRYLLSGRKSALVLGLFSELISNPLGFLGALGNLVRLIWNAGGGVVRPVAYLLEAISLRHLAKLIKLITFTPISPQMQLQSRCSASAWVAQTTTSPLMGLLSLSTGAHHRGP